MRTCKFAANCLDMDNDLEKTIKKAYLLFKKEFIDNEKTLRNKRIVVNMDNDMVDYGELLNSYKGSAFVHIVTQDGVEKKKREIVQDRLVCIPLISKMIDNYNDTNSNCLQCNKFYITNQKTSDGKIRTRIFCDVTKYVIIFEDYKDHCRLITAFRAIKPYYCEKFKR